MLFHPPSSPSIAVAYLDSAGFPVAKKLAAELDLKLIDDPAGLEAKAYSYLLVSTPHYLGLMRPNRANGSKTVPFYIDFLASNIQYRAHQASLRKEALARAMGISPRLAPLVIDCTAGLGRDSFILASLGFKVVMLERSPILHSLLKDALSRAEGGPCPITAASIAKLQLVQAESSAWLTPSLQADVIYLDPMFAEKQKSASSKKEITILQDLLGTGNEQADNELLKLALACATRRVVVKRHRLAASLDAGVGRKPDFSLKGKSCRFDVYLCNAH